MSNWKKPTIPEYFHGKNVFLTGGTGFVGKVLIEKLLRSCPQVGDIYVLVRQKRGKTIEERSKEITDARLFDIIKKENSKALDKVKCIAGDVTELNLGLSEEDKKFLISQVNIIYHAAASVRFDDPLRKAIITNVRSTREIIKLALQCIQLEAFVHVSTAYCNVDNKFIEEKLYPAPVNWRDAIDLAESDMDLSLWTVKYIAPWPNTYTFTKRIAEHVTQELCKDNIPAIIIRPSIIVNSNKEPVPGWVDNLNGPFSLIVAAMIGITSSFYGREDSYLDFIAVDNVVKGMVIATWEKGLSKGKSEIPIYNACSDILWKMGWFLTFGADVTKAVFFEKTIWNFTVGIHRSYYAYLFTTLFHVAINAVIDQILRLQGKKPRLFKLIRTIFVAQGALYYFMINHFVFDTKNFDQMDSKLLENDKEAFMQTMRPVEENEAFSYAMNCMSGIKHFVFNEKELSPEETTRRTKRFQNMKYAVNYTVSVIIIYLILVTWVI